MKLLIWDVDGTLVDSQHLITASMRDAFEGQGMALPDRQTMLSVVGLSLPDAIRFLAPDAEAATQSAWIEGYKQAYFANRQSESAPLYPGAREALDSFKARDDVLMAIATGKSARGLVSLIEIHELEGYFISLQNADLHPSKPNPSMIAAAMADAGVEVADTAMIGDTSFDMDMAQNAGVTGFGVAWGYHDPETLRASGARGPAADYPQLEMMLDSWINE